MNLPSGSWIVVTRPVKARKDRGDVIKYLVSESAAKRIAATHRTATQGAWAMLESDY